MKKYKAPKKLKAPEGGFLQQDLRLRHVPQLRSAGGELSGELTVTREIQIQEMKKLLYGGWHNGIYKHL